MAVSELMFLYPVGVSVFADNTIRGSCRYFKFLQCISQYYIIDVFSATISFLSAGLIVTV
jgi:hypothetical protein